MYWRRLNSEVINSVLYPGWIIISSLDFCHCGLKLGHLLPLSLGVFNGLLLRQGAELASDGARGCGTLSKSAFPDLGDLDHDVTTQDGRKVNPTALLRPGSGPGTFPSLREAGLLSARQGTGSSLPAPGQAVQPRGLPVKWTGRGRLTCLTQPG